MSANCRWKWMKHMSYVKINGANDLNALTLSHLQRCSPYVDLFESSRMEHSDSSSVSGCKRSGGGTFYCFLTCKYASNDKMNSHFGHSNGPSTYIIWSTIYGCSRREVAHISTTTNKASMVLNRRHCYCSENGWRVPQLWPRLTIAAHRMKAGGLGNGMEAPGQFNTGCWRSNGRCSVGS